MKIKIPESKHPRIVIIGGGFGGLKLAKKLNNKPYQVVLIDRNNYHTFQPLLYQVATGALEPAAIAAPFRNIFEKSKNIFFRMAETLEIVSDEKKIVTSIGDLHYDYLVLATGSKTNFFGMKQVEKHAMSMKSIPQSLDLRSLFLQNLESALEKDGGDEKESLMDIVVVGGGPTGVETAGALAELKKHVFPEDYNELDFQSMDIYLVEAGPRLLRGMSESASNKTKEFLEELGVQVWLNTALESYDGYRAVFNNGRQILTTSLIWTAGVEANPTKGLKKAHFVAGNRIAVGEFLRVKGYSNIYAIGDVAAVQYENGRPAEPMVAPAAIQQGRYLADYFMRKHNGLPLKPFKYFDKGTMATIGRHKAVVDISIFRFQGMFAWFVWMFVHLMSLVGFRNRYSVFMNWMWNYLSYDKSMQLIIRPFKKNVSSQTFETQEV